VKGTKLWNQPRSPLIQGRSRRERPFWSDWLAGAACAVAAGALVSIVVLLPKGSGLAESTRSVLLPLLAGACAGSVGGVWLAAAFGWHPRWVAGSVFGSFAAVIVTWAAIAFGAGPV